jgi:hypothetical protein
MSDNFFPCLPESDSSFAVYDDPFVDAAASDVLPFVACPAPDAAPGHSKPGWKVVPDITWTGVWLGGVWPTNVSPPASVMAAVSRHLRLRRTSKNRNKIKKGDGKDARADPRDYYAFEAGQAYNDITELNGGPALAPIVFTIAKLVADTFAEQVTAPNRFAKRRVPNPYSWMDEHWQFVNPRLLADLFARAKQVAWKSK